MQNNVSLLEQIYGELYNIDIVRNQVEFSNKVAGRSNRWYSTIRNNGGNISTDSLVTMTRRINIIAKNTSSRVAKAKLKDISVLLSNELDNKLRQNEYAYD
jgi:hypothetical protein